LCLVGGGDQAGKSHESAIGDILGQGSGSRT
jgi:hypothetical protein